MLRCVAAARATGKTDGTGEGSVVAVARTGGGGRGVGGHETRRGGRGKRWHWQAAGLISAAWLFRGLIAWGGSLLNSAGQAGFWCRKGRPSSSALARPRPLFITPPAHWRWPRKRRVSFLATAKPSAHGVILPPPCAAQPAPRRGVFCRAYPRRCRGWRRPARNASPPAALVAARRRAGEQASGRSSREVGPGCQAEMHARRVARRAGGLARYRRGSTSAWPCLLWRPALAKATARPGTSCSSPICILHHCSPLCLVAISSIPDPAPRLCRPPSCPCPPPGSDPAHNASSERCVT